MSGEHFLGEVARGADAHRLEVTAVNGLGESLPSGETQATAIDVPGAPTGLGAVAGNGSVTLSWTAPTDTGGDALSGYWCYLGASVESLWKGPYLAVYVYAYRAGNKRNPAGTYRLLVSYVTSSSASYQVTGLSSGKTYAFTVSAHNAGGWSAESVYSDPVP